MLIKRKQADFNDEETQAGLYEGSDFKQRKEKSFARKRLKDKRPSSEFQVTEQGVYANDLE